MDLLKFNLRKSIDAEVLLKEKSRSKPAYNLENSCTRNFIFLCLPLLF